MTMSLRNVKNLRLYILYIDGIVYYFLSNPVAKMHTKTDFKTKSNYFTVK